MYVFIKQQKFKKFFKIMLTTEHYYVIINASNKEQERGCKYEI